MKENKTLSLEDKKAIISENWSKIENHTLISVVGHQKNDIPYMTPNVVQPLYLAAKTILEKETKATDKKKLTESVDEYVNPTLPVEEPKEEATPVAQAKEFERGDRVCTPDAGDGEVLNTFMGIVRIKLDTPNAQGKDTVNYNQGDVKFAEVVSEDHSDITPPKEVGYNKELDLATREKSAELAGDDEDDDWLSEYLDTEAEEIKEETDLGFEPLGSPADDSDMTEIKDKEAITPTDAPKEPVAFKEPGEPEVLDIEDMASVGTSANTNSSPSQAPAITSTKVADEPESAEEKEEEQETGEEAAEEEKSGFSDFLKSKKSEENSEEEKEEKEDSISEAEIKTIRSIAESRGFKLISIKGILKEKSNDSSIFEIIVEKDGGKKAITYNDGVSHKPWRSNDRDFQFLQDVLEYNNYRF